MVRNKKRKTEKGSFTQQQMEKGLDLMKKGMSSRKAANEAGVNYKTLQRYAKKYMLYPEPLSSVRLVPKYNHRQIFPEDCEAELSDYIIERSDSGYDLTISEVQELAYELAKEIDLNYPASWDAHKKAGSDWYSGFMSRHPELSPRKPEQCSVARPAAINKPVTTAYSKKFEKVLGRNPRFADGSRTSTADETGTPTVGVIKNGKNCDELSLPVPVDLSTEPSSISS